MMTRSFAFQTEREKEQSGSSTGDFAAPCNASFSTIENKRTENKIELTEKGFDTGTTSVQRNGEQFCIPDRAREKYDSRIVGHPRAKGK